MRTTRPTYTPINVTLTEGRSESSYVVLRTMYSINPDLRRIQSWSEIDQIFEELENAVDDHYNQRMDTMEVHYDVWTYFIIIISIIGFMLIFYDPHR